MVLVYLPTKLGDFVRANVAKYTSTMEHLGSDLSLWLNGCQPIDNCLFFLTLIFLLSFGRQSCPITFWLPLRSVTGTWFYPMNFGVCYLSDRSLRVRDSITEWSPWSPMDFFHLTLIFPTKIWWTLKVDTCLSPRSQAYCCLARNEGMIHNH